jgi:hypothetical protein
MDAIGSQLNETILAAEAQGRRLDEDDALQEEEIDR